MSSQPRGASFQGRGRGNPFSPQSVTPFRGSSRPRGRGSDNATRRGNSGGRGAFGQAPRGNGASSARVRGGFARGGSAFGQQAASHKTAAGGAISSGTWADRAEKLSKHRERERTQAIAQGLMTDPDKQISITDAITIVGTCQDMCPENERVLRNVRDDVWAEEKDPLDPSRTDEARMVKAFRRSAAGDEAQIPSDLRPPTVLKRTCDYLFHEIVGNASALGKVHHFVWDRTRAIRNDFSIQQVKKWEDLRIAIDCYERIARFHISSLHELAGPTKPYAKYDPQQEREQLDRTLLSLMQYYDDSRGHLDLPNEAEFRAYCVILQLRDPTPDLEDRIQSWPVSVRDDNRVRTAIEVYAAACSTIWPEGPIDKIQHVIARQDWEGFWKLVESKKVSFLLACVAETHFMMIREMALSAIVRSARVTKKKNGVTDPNTEWTVEDLDRVFGFDNDEDLESFCGRWNLQFETREEDGQSYLDIRYLAGKPLPQGDAAKSSQIKSSLVEDKRHGRTLPAVIDGMNVRQARDAGLVVEEEQEEEAGDSMGDATDGSAVVEDGGEDEDSLFIPETKPAGKNQESTLFGPESSGKGTFAGFGQTSTPFGQQSTSPFSQSSPFGRPSSGFSFKPAETSQSTEIGEKKSPFDFLLAKPKENATSKAAEAPASAPPKTLDSPALKLNPTGTTTSSGSMGGTFGTEPAKTAPSLFSQKPTTPSTPTNLFAPKTAATGGSLQNEASGGNVPEKSTSPAPMFSFLNSAPKPEQAPVTEKPSFQIGATNGVPAAPSLFAPQVESNLKPPPSPAQAQSASGQQPTTPTTQNATISTSGSQSPPRRPSATNWEAHKTKKPSPLSNSFTAGDDSAATEQKLHPQSAHVASNQPSRELFSDKQSVRPASPQTKPATPPPTQTSTANEQLQRLATHLTFDTDNGFLKQYLDFVVKRVIVQAQEKVFDEKCKIKCQALEERRLIREYGVWWRGFARHRRLAAKSRQRRERTRERLRKSTTEGSLDGFTESDTTSIRRDSIPSSAKHRRDKKDVVDALFQSIAGDMQATAGSKRSAPPNGRDMPAKHERQKNLSHVDDRGRVSKSAPTSHPNADLLKRSSFLSYSTANNHTNGPSTTKSTYFRMKALGVNSANDSILARQPRGMKRQRSESFDVDRIGASQRSTPSTADAPTPEQQRDRESMPPPATKPKTNDEDDALFARLRAAREALQEGESIMKEELSRSMSGSLSSNESPSMERARAEAKLRMSNGWSDFDGSSSARSIPAYQLRESRFVPREEYGLARERALEKRASRSRDNSRSTSRTGERFDDAPSHSAVAKSNAASKAAEVSSIKTSSLSGQDAMLSKTSGQAGGQFSNPGSTRPFAQFGATFGQNKTTTTGTTNAPSFGTAKPVSEFGSQQPISHATSRNPFSQSSSFAPLTSAGQNPFLQTTTPTSYGAPLSRSTRVDNDQTVQPSQINESLAHTFGRPAASTTHGSPTPPQTNSYIPSQVVSETISLLSDDEDEDGGEVSYGQREFHANGTQDGATFGNPSATESFETDGAGNFLQGAYDYANSFAILADQTGEDEEEEEDEQIRGSAFAQQHSYQYSDGEDDQVGAANDEEYDEEGLEDNDELSLNSYFDEHAEEAEDDGDVEDMDEGGYDDDESLDSDEEEDESDDEHDTGQFASLNQAYNRRVQQQAPRVDPALQAVGNTAEEAIELSD